MSLKHTYALSIKNDAGGTVLADTTIFTADAEHNISDVVGAGETLEIDINVDVDQIVSFFAESDKDVTMTTNNASTALADQTFQLLAKKGLYWNTDRHDSNPLTVDITTGLFFKNAGSVDANVRAGFLVDAGV
jgi:hypothetical protein